MSKQTQIELFVYGRASYLYCHEPYINKEGKKSFKTHILLDSATPGIPGTPIKSGAEYIEMVKDAQRKVASAAWPSNTQGMLAKLAGKDFLCLHNGDISMAGKEDYKGKLFISASNKTRPLVVETREGKNVPLVATDNRPYSGSWCLFHIAIWAQDPEGKKPTYGERINAQLMGVHFIKHDAAFGGGGRVSSADEFAPISVEEADAPAPAAAAAGNSLF